MTDVSEEHVATIFGIIRISELGATLAVTSNRTTPRRNTNTTKYYYYYYYTNYTTTCLFSVWFSLLITANFVPNSFIVSTLKV
jgi:hypothetical protein